MKGKLTKASGNPLAAQIREAIGASPDEDVIVITPKFTRPPDWPVPSPPESRDAFLALRSLSVEVLHEMGMRQWDESLWLYPGEWYVHIPAGLDVIDIFGNEDVFVPGMTDNDIRFGQLSFGFIRDGDTVERCGETCVEHDHEGTWTATCSRAKGHAGMHCDVDAEWCW